MKDEKKNSYLSYKQRKLVKLVDKLLLHMNTKGRITTSGFDWDSHLNN